MSDETPVNPNPATGGGPVESLSEPADPPPPPQAAAAATEAQAAAPSSTEVASATAQLAGITIGSGPGQAAAAGAGGVVVETVQEGVDSDDDGGGEAVVAHTAAPAGALAGSGAHAFNFNLGAAAAQGDDDDDDIDEDGQDEEDMMQMLPPCIIRRVEKLRDLNAEREKVMEEYQAERAALERKFAGRHKPLYDKRVDIIAGGMDDEIDAEVAADPDNDDGDYEGGAGDEDIVGIPQFWVCALGHMEQIAELITERDVDCLEHLRDVTCVDDEKGEGFTLEFHFGPNDYFYDTKLTKKYEIPNLLLDDEPILKNVSGCDINWKPDMCLTHREVKKKQRSKSGKKAGQIRTIIKKERAESFFHFFCPPKIPTMDEMDEEEADAIEQAFDVDYDVAQAFRSHIIPRAVLWFTGEALDEGMDIAEGEWPGGDDDDDAPPPPAAASPFPPPVGDGENPEECKQN